MSGQTERRVLVIDDDELSREVLSILLAGEGYLVDVASSGDEALRSLSAARAAPDMVLMDMRMTGISGEELGRRLRELGGTSMKLIAMSASRSEGSKAGALDAFLLKPFSMSEFSEALERVDERASSEPGGERPDSASGGEVLDPRIFKMFEGTVGKEQLRELYGFCLSDAERQLTAMRAAAAAGDDAKFRQYAHTTKGGLGMLGARELQRMCGLLEEAGLTGNYLATLAEIPEAADRLRHRLIALGVQL